MLRRASRSIVALVSLTALTMLGPAPSALALTCGSSTLQSVPAEVSTENRVFFGVGAWTATNAWAVGRRTLSGSKVRPLAEHLVSGSFVTEAMPSFTTSTRLQDAVAVSKSEVWAVGGTRDAATGRFQTLVLHRTAQGWKRVPSPNLSANNNQLWGVDATSPTNVWAVGDAIVKGTDRTLIARLVNGAWKRVPSPSLKSGSALDAIDVRSATDAWAVGWSTTAGGVYKTLILHWDGASWTRTPSPSPSASDSSLYAVAAVGAKDAWAAGAKDTGVGYDLLYLHWDGSSWSEVAGPQPAGDPIIEDATADSDGHVWFVGMADGPVSVVVRRTTSTTLESVSPDGTSGAALFGAGTAPGTNASFAVGSAAGAAAWRSCV